MGRNDPCPCGSGKKYKNCHIDGVELRRILLEKLGVAAKRTVDATRACSRALNVEEKAIFAVYEANIALTLVGVGFSLEVAKVASKHVVSLMSHERSVNPFVDMNCSIEPVEDRIIMTLWCGSETMVVDLSSPALPCKGFKLGDRLRESVAGIPDVSASEMTDTITANKFGKPKVPAQMISASIVSHPHRESVVEQARKAMILGTMTKMVHDVFEGLSETEALEKVRRDFVYRFRDEPEDVRARAREVAAGPWSQRMLDEIRVPGSGGGSYAVLAGMMLEVRPTNKFLREMTVAAGRKLEDVMKDYPAWPR